VERQRILVVDDDAALAENVAEIVGDALDVDVEVADRLKAALTRIQDRRFDLVLSDVRLPDGDGNDLVEPLRARWPHAEVVLITGDATVTSAIAAVRGGAFAYVLKPFAPPEMLEIARRALGQARMAIERERFRDELERSEKRHRQVIEAVPALVLALDGRGRIAIWNARLEQTTGFTRAEMIGQPGEALVGSGGVRPLAVKGKEGASAERLVRWETARVSSEAADAETWTYAVGTDVSAEQEMLRRTLRAERLAAVGTMAAGLAHEVRNPLNSAVLQLQVLRRRLARAETTRDSLDGVAALVEDEIRRLERLVSDFLSFARPRPLERRPTDIGELCRGIATLLAPEAETSKVRIDVQLAPDLQPIDVDPERIRQVLQNLMRNSLEAMPAGGVVTLRTRTVDGKVEIDVADTGPGFGDETPIFDAFFTTKSIGTGLGLSIVHRIVTDHGGNVRVRSRPGDTCFTVALPL